MSTPFNTTEERIEQVCRAFRIEGNFLGSEVITRGNINTTIRVDFENNGIKKSYLLQRVNTYVFTNPLKIMNNINLVTTHIRNKNTNSNKTNLHFHHCANGDNFYFDLDGEFWRLTNYIDSLSFDLCDDPAILQGAGYAFGEFQTALEDFDASQLYETIPDFHNTPKRYETFLNAVQRDDCGRVCEVANEIEFTKKHAKLASKLIEMKHEGLLPLRVTHNDTKSNNVLFDRVTGKPLTVIDLDTVMPGLVAFDFGDAIRSAGNSTEEDETDLSKVYLDIGKFSAFAEGFLKATAGHITEAEIDSLALGSFVLTYECGMRFLTDYLEGDKYFRTAYEGHNLVRAKCQYKLAEDILNKLPEMEQIVRNIASKYQ